MPFDALKAELELELGQRLAEIFAEVDPEPLAAASMAQMHRARPGPGGAVVLKIRRPGIARDRPVAVAREFAQALRAELDLSDECRNAERVGQAFGDDPLASVPGVHWQYTRATINVQSLVPGVKGTDLDAVRAAGIDLKTVARRGADAVLKMIFRDRFFHADPHPGKVFYGPGGAITFIDFGVVGQITAIAVFPIAGFIGASLGALWLLHTILRRRQDKGRGRRGACQSSAAPSMIACRAGGVVLRRRRGGGMVLHSMMAARDCGARKPGSDGQVRLTVRPLASYWPQPLARICPSGLLGAFPRCPVLFIYGR